MADSEGIGEEEEIEIIIEDNPFAKKFKRRMMDLISRKKIPETTMAWTLEDVDLNDFEELNKIFDDIFYQTNTNTIERMRSALRFLSTLFLESGGTCALPGGAIPPFCRSLKELETELIDFPSEEETQWLDKGAINNLHKRYYKKVLACWTELKTLIQWIRANEAAENKINKQALDLVDIGKRQGHDLNALNLGEETILNSIKEGSVKPVR